MDIKEYISSGIIEAYVMGLASEEEVRILECVQKNSPEVRQAILEAEQLLGDFASSQAMAPPPELKAEVWAKLSEIQQEGEKPTMVVVPASKQKDTQDIQRWIAIAATILLVISVGFNFYFNYTQNNIQTELALLSNTNQKNQLAYQNLKSRWDLVNREDIKTIPLAGVEKHPDVKATVYFGSESNEVYLALDNLPQAPKDQQYQLWAIVEGSPVSLGMFDQENELEVQRMASVIKAQAFAITLEKRGGSAVPTLENMYVMGKM